MTTEKYLRQRVLTQNIEITTLTTRIDSLLSTVVDLKEQLNDEKTHHVTFVDELDTQVKALTKQLQDLKMDMCRSELDKTLNHR
tara:strand:- start:57846 stop:58097 length:252 start_codon:yes stop_codon:yes gene_type:complete